MKPTHHTLLVVALILAAGIAAAVPPSYEGPLGNPEEPALRVIKWPWLGLRKLFVSTQSGLDSGIHKHPPAAIGEGAQGAAAGTRTLVHHTAKGVVYAPLPLKKPLQNPETYEQHVERALNALYPDPDACTAGHSPVPGQDHPVAVDSVSEAQQEGAPLLAARTGETEVQKAQRRYVPLRAGYRDRHKRGTGNLLRLAQ